MLIVCSILWFNLVIDIHEPTYHITQFISGHLIKNPYLWLPQTIIYPRSSLLKFGIEAHDVAHQLPASKVKSNKLDGVDDDGLQS